MCGIAGLVADNLAPYRGHLDAMSAAIAHRGPDDLGAWTDERAALRHRRLSIIDTSSGGHQPMESPCGRYVMVYNGEIYNYVELRQDLESQGAVFHSHSDTEVLLAAFVAHGPDCLTRLNGMWAFAVWDKTARRLFVSRDRFGEKPFYYALHRGAFLFASEIKALLALGLLDRAPNPAMVADFCAERVSDHTQATFFKGISQLRPGTWAWWSDGRLDEHRYWQLPADAPAPAAGNIVDEVADLLEDSVRLRLRADTRVGTLLSGGLDSSGVTCLAARLASDGLSAFSTVSAQPPEEAAGIDMVLKAHPSIQFHPDEPGPGCLDEELAACLWHQEEPFADGSMLAHFRLMRLARESGVRVLLSGQAADEVFAGYPGHQAVHLGGMIGRGMWPEAMDFYRALEANGQAMPWRSIGGYALPPWLSSRMRRGRIDQSIDWVADGYNAVTPSVSGGYASQRDADPLNAALRESLTCRTLPAFLHYEDRNSMAFGVETRIPFLDHRLVAKVLPLPGSIKLANGRTKALLRSALADRMPAPILKRLAKQGYPAPLPRWLRASRPSSAAARLERVAACPLITFSKWRPRYDRFLAGDDDELPAVWRGTILAMWHARFMEQTG